MWLYFHAFFICWKHWTLFIKTDGVYTFFSPSWISPLHIWQSALLLAPPTNFVAPWTLPKHPHLARDIFPFYSKKFFSAYSTVPLGLWGWGVVRGGWVGEPLSYLLFRLVFLDKPSRRKIGALQETSAGYLAYSNIAEQLDYAKWMVFIELPHVNCCCTAAI